MYTLEIDAINRDALYTVQALVQENALLDFTYENCIYSQRVKVSTMSLRELKRLVDLLESEEFMC